MRTTQLIQSELEIKHILIIIVKPSGSESSPGCSCLLLRAGRGEWVALLRQRPIWGRCPKHILEFWICKKREFYFAMYLNNMRHMLRVIQPMFLS